MPTTNALIVDIIAEGAATVIKVLGEVGVAGAEELGRRLLPVTASRPPIVIFDLEGLTFISSLGLSILMEFQRGLNRHGGIVRLINPQPAVHEMLKKCRLDTVLIVAKSMQEAVAATRS
jgi:anti-sigma B factor antagonist